MRSRKRSWAARAASSAGSAAAGVRLTVVAAEVDVATAVGDDVKGSEAAAEAPLDSLRKVFKWHFDGQGLLFLY